MADDTTVPVPRRRRMRKRLLGGGFAVVVVVAVFVFFLPRIADYRDVWDVLKDLSWKDGLLLAAATLLNVVTFAPPWIAALPGLGLRQALVLTQASTALSIVSPAGAAVGMAGSFAMLRSWGFKSGPVGLAVAVTGVWNQLANLTFPIVALALLTAANESHAGLRTTALVGVVVLVVVVCAFVLALSSESRAYRVGELAARLTNRTLRLVRRDPVSWGGESLAVLRLGTIDLLRRLRFRVTVNTDNRLMSNVSMSSEFAALDRAFGLGLEELEWLTLNGIKSAFAAFDARVHPDHRDLDRPGLAGRGVRSLGARSDPGSATADAGRARVRRARTERRARRLRSVERGRSGRDAPLPVPHRHADAGARTCGGSDMEDARQPRTCLGCPPEKFGSPGGWIGGPASRPRSHWLPQ